MGWVIILFTRNSFITLERCIMCRYPAKITQDGKYFLVTFRDFAESEPAAPALSLEEAVSIASDWLACQIVVARDAGEKLPEPSRALSGETMIEVADGVDWDMPVLVDGLDASLQCSRRTTGSA
jgi:predicted RNase H-like HicB family nuclease